MINWCHNKYLIYISIKDKRNTQNEYLKHEKCHQYMAKLIFFKN